MKKEPWGLASIFTSTSELARLATTEPRTKKTRSPKRNWITVPGSRVRAFILSIDKKENTLSALAFYDKHWHYMELYGSTEILAVEAESSSPFAQMFRGFGRSMYGVPMVKGLVVMVSREQARKYVRLQKNSIKVLPLSAAPTAELIEDSIQLWMEAYVADVDDEED